MQMSDFTRKIKPEYYNLPYRRCVGITIINSEKKVFVGKRVDGKPNFWQMPQGGIDDNETIIEAAKREMLEETGIANSEIVAVSKKWLYYDIPECLIPKLWDSKYRGQKQKWILTKFSGDENEINLDLHHKEFKEWKWVDIEDLPRLVVPFKRKIYHNIIEEFYPIIKNLKI